MQWAGHSASATPDSISDRSVMSATMSGATSGSISTRTWRQSEKKFGRRSRPGGPQPALMITLAMALATVPPPLGEAVRSLRRLAEDAEARADRPRRHGLGDRWRERRRFNNRR